MKLSKLIRIAALSLITLTPALTVVADPPAPEPCTCEYCSRTSPTRNCIFFDGSTTTCGYFLAVSTCPAN